ncbi:ABC transporter ATP-binding protein [Oceanithermus sp.]
MIEIQALTKRYGRFVALEGLDLSVRPGETLALLGPNGAGKTTTIRALTGQLRPTSGRVFVAGHDVWRQPVAAKRAFGYVPDRPYLYGKLTAVELLRFVARIYGLDDQRAERGIGEVLERFRLERYASALIETYSHGMRQKLTFAAALLPEPAVLIVDEPMVGLDPVAARTVRNLLATYSKPDRAVLFSTHQMELAESAADRIALLHRGRLHLLGSPAEVRARHGDASLEEIFIRLTEDAAQSDPPAPAHPSP